MDNEKKIAKLKESKYQVLFGVHKETFERMLAIVNTAYEEMHKKGGRKRKLSVLDMLIITLEYYHDYRTMENISFDYGVHKQRICEAIAFVEQVLIKDGAFSLPSKRKLTEENEVAIVIIDVTECETECPKKNKNQAIPARKNGTQLKTKSS
jgi:hypothetical protein